MRLRRTTCPQSELHPQVMAQLAGEINDIWKRRHTIRPSHARRRRPGVLEVYGLLPGDNCRRCGEATCFIFAGKLVVGQVDLQRCPRLPEPAYRRQQAHLQRLVALAAAQPPGQATGTEEPAP